MALVMNARPEAISVLVGGNWFEFKPEQIKLIHNDKIAHFMCTDKSYEGLVSVPDFVGEDRSSPESKAALSEAKKTGVANRIQYLEKVKHNLLVSLGRDLEMKNIKVDPLRMASAGEKKALKELAGYEAANQVEQEKEYQELKSLTDQMAGKVEPKAKK